MREKKPVIGIPVGPFLQELAGKHIINSPYIHAVEMTGGIPLLLPVTEDPGMAKSYIDLIDGLLVPGGADVSPALYGEAALPQVTYIIEKQDSLELELIRLAAEQDKPIFGICRGAQMLNIAFGGTLYQDLPSQYADALQHRQDPSDRTKTTHAVMLEKDSLAARLLKTEKIMVNSYHHQAIKEVAPDFAVTARAEDGVVEAIESRLRRIYAVQWHPEELVDKYPAFQALFRHLMEQSAVS